MPNRADGVTTPGLQRHGACDTSTKTQAVQKYSNPYYNPNSMQVPPVFGLVPVTDVHLVLPLPFRNVESEDQQNAGNVTAAVSVQDRESAEMVLSFPFPFL